MHDESSQYSVNMHVKYHIPDISYEKLFFIQIWIKFHSLLRETLTDSKLLNEITFMTYTITSAEHSDAKSLL